MSRFTLLLSIAPALLAGCFNPSGSASTSDTASSSGATTSDTTTAASTSGATTGDPTTGTTTDGTTTTATDTTLTTLPGTTELTTVDLTSTSVVTDTTSDLTGTTGGPICGNGVVEAGELCDDGNMSDNDECIGTCKLATCGDGVVYDGVEQCDDGNINNDDGCDPQCTLEQPLLVFLSDMVFAGNAVKPAQADTYCTDAAPAEYQGRNFVAWISTQGSPVVTRLVSGIRPYARLDGTIVATTTAGLLDGALDAAINITETNMMLTPPKGGCDPSGPFAWTGTLTAGQASPDNCNGWMPINMMEMGTVGSFAEVDAKTANWTAECELDCVTKLRIYCIEKGD